MEFVLECECGCRTFTEQQDDEDGTVFVCDNCGMVISQDVAGDYITAD